MTEAALRLEEPQVMGLLAPEGALATEQLRATVPVNPPMGATVMVEVLPVVAPASRVRVDGLLDRAKVEEGAVEADTTALMASVCTYSPVASLPVIRTL